MSRRSTKRERLRGRRSLDYRAMTSIDGQILHVRPYCGVEDAQKGKTATAEEGADGLVTLYDVICTCDLPTSPTTMATGITTRFDNSVDGYPVSSPVAHVISPEKPYSTHVSPVSGVVCLGDLWRENKGCESLAELVLRVHYAYNFQDPKVGLEGYQTNAEVFREQELRDHPFNPDIVWPVVSLDAFLVPQNSGPARQRVVVFRASRPLAETQQDAPPAAPRPRLVILSGRQP